MGILEEQQATYNEGGSFRGDASRRTILFKIPDVLASGGRG